jgi:hypothetical protein
MVAAVALAHDGAPGDGEPYAPPAVESVPPGLPVTWVAPPFEHLAGEAPAASRVPRTEPKSDLSGH